MSVPCPAKSLLLQRLNPFRSKPARRQNCIWSDPGGPLQIHPPVLRFFVAFLCNLYKEMMQLLRLQFVYIVMNRMTSPNEGLWRKGIYDCRSKAHAA
jgi:hypothetical protein